MIESPSRRSFKRRSATLTISSIICSTWLLVAIIHYHLSWPGRATSPTQRTTVSNPRRIGKVSMLHGISGIVYERGIRVHERHAQRWGYPMHVLRHPFADGYWNKPTYLLSLVVKELAKPPQERLEWLVYVLSHTLPIGRRLLMARMQVDMPHQRWVDADTVILNKEIPLDIFLPPPDLEQIHCVVSKDHNGLNTGVLFLRVHHWTVSFLVETIGYPLYLPEQDLGSSADQTSMDRVLSKTMDGPEGKGYQDGWVYTPRSWTNAYEWGRDFEGHVGTLLIHFPGMSPEDRSRDMTRWLDEVEMTPNVWEAPLEETDYPSVTGAFWAQVRNARNAIKAGREASNSMPTNTTNEIVALVEMNDAVEALEIALREKADETDLVRDRLVDLKYLLRVMGTD